MNDETDITPAPAKPVPWATMLAAAAALVVFYWPAALLALEYDRGRIVAGEWWRVFTGNWVHLSRSSLLWNLAVLLPAGVWAEQLRPWRTRLLFIVAPAFIGALVFFAAPELTRFGTLSAVATAVLAFLALAQLRVTDSDRWFWRAVLVLLGLKIVAEAAVASRWFTPFPDPAITVVPLTHLAALATASVVLSARRRKKDSR